MRTITEHAVNAANDRLAISVLDEPGAGGANHHYRVVGDPDSGVAVDILFQNGPINENGVNGLTQEVLLAIVADRLRSFQSGKFACRENAIALTKIEEAQHWLHRRTRGRMSRCVEGTHAV